MLIETKFSVGDQRWMIWDNQLTLVTIEKIDVEVDVDQQITIYYYPDIVNIPILFTESKLIKDSFPTKQELINSL